MVKKFPVRPSYIRSGMLLGNPPMLFFILLIFQQSLEAALSKRDKQLSCRKFGKNSLHHTILTLNCAQFTAFGLMWLHLRLFPRTNQRRLSALQTRHQPVETKKFCQSELNSRAVCMRSSNEPWAFKVVRSHNIKDYLLFGHMCMLYTVL